MMIPKSGGKGHTGGPLDIICILHGDKQGRYHPCSAEEHPLPDPIQPIAEMEMVRLKSKMHHTEGFATFEEAVDNVHNDMLNRIEVRPENLALRQPIEWDEAEMVFSWVVPNWNAREQTIDDVLFGAAVTP